ncbi:hypothetical protein AURDEDRAFT_166188 [Auricularia subglabra TFB-10046 SS5]|nr:hypothetical protein AURDEDRAFT_166188 [Auricularia subglabra TFB-10046 SS5]
MAKSKNPASKPKNQAKASASASTTSRKSTTSSKAKSKSTLSAEALGDLVKKNPGLIKMLLSSNVDLLNEAAQEQRRTAHKRRPPVRSPSTVSNDGNEENEDAGTGDEDEDANDDMQQDDESANPSGSEVEYQVDTDADDEDQSDDENESPLRHKQPQKRSAAESNSGEPPAKKLRKSRTSNADPAVTIGKSVTLLRPLPRPRAAAGATPDTAGQTETPAAPPSTPTHRRGTDAADVTNADPAATVPCTPYVRLPNPKKKRRILEGPLTDDTQDLLDDLKSSYRVYIVTKNAFPSLKETEVYVKDRLPDALKAGKKKGRIGRATDKTYRDDLAKLLYGKSSDIRNHLVAVAKSVAVEYYKLNNFKGTGARRSEVQGLFEHPAICAVIQKAFFMSSKPAFNVARMDDYKACFDPFPRQLLALAGVALRCALDQWRTGAFAQVKFEGDVYKTPYQELLDKISNTVDDEPELKDWFEVQCFGWYAEARDSAGIFDSDSDGEANGDDDADAIARNRAAMRAAMQAAHAARAVQDGAAENQGSGGPGASAS